MSTWKSYHNNCHLQLPSFPVVLSTLKTSLKAYQSVLRINQHTCNHGRSSNSAQTASKDLRYVLSGFFSLFFGPWESSAKKCSLRLLFQYLHSEAMQNRPVCHSFQYRGCALRCSLIESVLADRWTSFSSSVKLLLVCKVFNHYYFRILKSLWDWWQDSRAFQTKILLKKLESPVHVLSSVSMISTGIFWMAAAEWLDNLSIPGLHKRPK